MNDAYRKRVGKAIPEAWQAAQRAATKILNEHQHRNYTHLSWSEIRHQLMRFGDTVDTTIVPPMWTSESPQMHELNEILQKAGFEQQEHLFVWRSDADLSS